MSLTMLTGYNTDNHPAPRDPFLWRDPMPAVCLVHQVRISVGLMMFKS